MNATASSLIHTGVLARGALRENIEMHERHCELFGGASGKLIVLLLTGGAFAFYVGSFAAKKRLRIDHRTWEVFWLDLLKMGLGQTFALAINVLNAHRNSSAEFDPVSWYLPTFLNDEIIAVPLGVLIWHMLLLRMAAAVGRQWYPRSVFFQALQASGRYYPTQGDNCAGGDIMISTRIDGNARVALVTTSEPPVCGPAGEAARCIGRRCSCLCGEGEPRMARYDWWLVQTSMWVLCVLCSRLLGGLVVPTTAAALHERSPYYLLAKAIDELDWTCDAKRWCFAGVLRIVIDVVQLAVVDFFNKFRTGRRAIAPRALASQECSTAHSGDDHDHDGGEQQARASLA